MNTKSMTTKELKSLQAALDAATFHDSDSEHFDNWRSFIHEVDVALLKREGKAKTKKTRKQEAK